MSIVNHVVRTPWRWSRWLLPRLWLVIPMGLAVYSLTEPWARARVVLFWGISRSPGALMLVLVSSLAMVIAGGVVAGRRRALRLAAGVHLVSGAFMCAVAWRAYQMVQDAGVKALGFIPLAFCSPERKHGPAFCHKRRGATSASNPRRRRCRTSGEG